MSALRFQHWFPASAREFANLTVTTCSAELSAYADAYQNSTHKVAINLGLGNTYDVYRLCDNVASCILSNSTQWNQSNLGTTNVVLGLLPTILAFIAPSMTEMAVLGVHRPLFAALLSLSSPAVLQSRVFDYEDPGEVLNKEHPRSDVRYPLTLGPWSARSASLAGVGGYLLALGSMINTLLLVIQLANSSVLGWGCTRTWPLFVWMFFPVVVHTAACYGYRLTLQKIKPNSQGNRRSEDTDVIPLQTVVEGGKATQSDWLPTASAEVTTAVSLPQISSRGQVRHRLHSEITSCASHTHTRFTARSRDVHPSKLRAGVLLNAAAGFFGFLHLIFATVTFSALLFVVPLDAIGEVAMRLMLSALVSRFVVMFELGGLRGRSEIDPSDHHSSATHEQNPHRLLHRA